MCGKQNEVSQNGVSQVPQASWELGVSNNSAGLGRGYPWTQVSGASGSWVCVYCNPGV